MITPYDKYDTVYRDFHITANFWSGYDWTHDNYDGAPDAGPQAIGNAKTIAACKAEIDEWYWEQTSYRVVTPTTITKFTFMAEAFEFMKRFGGELQFILDGEQMEFDSI